MTRTFTRHYEHHEIVWNGVRIAISYEPRWLSLSDDYGLDTAHLEIEAIEPERAMLPITETGYRSHFTTAATVDGYGGPVAFCAPGSMKKPPPLPGNSTWRLRASSPSSRGGGPFSCRQDLFRRDVHLGEQVLTDFL